MFVPKIEQDHGKARHAAGIKQIRFVSDRAEGKDILGDLADSEHFTGLVSRQSRL